MAILTQAQIDILGLPPQPLTPEQAINDAKGRPTREYHEYLVALHLYMRKLLLVLGDVPLEREEPGKPKPPIPGGSP